MAAIGAAAAGGSNRKWDLGICHAGNVAVYDPFRYDQWWYKYV